MKLNNESGMATDELLAGAVAVLLFPILWFLFCKWFDWSWWLGGLVAAGVAYFSVVPFMLIWSLTRWLREFLKRRKYKQK